MFYMYSANSEASTALDLRGGGPPPLGSTSTVSEKYIYLLALALRLLTPTLPNQELVIASCW